MRNENEKKASLSLTLGYGVGEFAGQMSWYMINTYLMIFYTNVVSLSAGAISLIMLIARVWDAINDPMMGMICDRTNTRWGRFRPYIMFGAPLLGFFNVLTFTIFPLTGALKVLVCLLCYIGAGMMYTVVSTAYFGLVNVLSMDSKVRQTLSACRNIFNSLGSVVLGAVAMPLILRFSNTMAEGEKIADGRGYFFATLIFSVVMIPIFMITAFTCKEKYTQQLHGNEAKAEKRSVIESIKLLLKNDQLVLVIANTLGGTIGVMGRMTMLSYYVIYVVGSTLDNPFAAYGIIAPVYTTMSIASIIGGFFVPKMTEIMGKKAYMILLNVIMVIGFIFMYMIPGAGLPMLLIVSAICGFCNSSQGAAFGMISDSIEYGDWKNGVREEALCCSFMTLSVKLATAIVGAGGVLLLAKFGYDAAAPVQTATAIQGINFVVNIVPAICVAVGIIPLLFYKLSNEKVAQISRDLQERAKASK